MKFIPTVKHGLNVAWRWSVKNAPEVLIIIGVAGLWCAGVMAAFEAPKTKEDLDKIDEEDKLDRVTETGKVILKHHWPEMVMAGASTLAIGAGNYINLTRLAGSAAAIKVFQKEIKDIHDGSLKVVGTKKTKDIEDRARIDDSISHMYESDDDIYETGLGRQLWYDKGTEKWFRCDSEYVRRAEYETKLRIWTSDEFVPINYLYLKMNRPCNGEFADTLGWRLKDFETYGHFSSFEEFKDNVSLLEYSSAKTDDLKSYMIMSFIRYDGWPPSYKLDDDDLY